MSAQCRTCRAPVLWVINSGSGKREPLDPEPREDGNIEIVGQESLATDGMESSAMIPVVRHLTGDELPLFGDAPERYVSHFATCPDAAQHRRPA